MEEAEKRIKSLLGKINCPDGQRQVPGAPSDKTFQNLAGPRLNRIVLAIKRPFKRSYGDVASEWWS